MYRAQNSRPDPLYWFTGWGLFVRLLGPVHLSAEVQFIHLL